VEDGNGVGLGEDADSISKTIPDSLEQDRRRDLVAKMRRQKRDNLASHLQLGHIPVEIDPVKAFDVQYDVTIEHIIDVDRLGHLDTSASEPPTCYTQPDIVLSAV
jgi:hypothetical protein